MRFIVDIFAIISIVFLIVLFAGDPDFSDVIQDKIRAETKLIQLQIDQLEILQNSKEDPSEPVQ